MNIVISGAGEVGRHAAEILGAEGHNITIIDPAAGKLYALEDVMDVRTLTGDGTHATTLIEAGCESADVFIAATQHDGTNLLSASVASSLGAGRTIARVHHSAFFVGRDFDYKHHLGIDHLVCPEYSTALAIARTLRNPGALAVERFARGKIEMQQLPVGPDAAVIGKPLIELKLPESLRIAAIERNGATFIPDASAAIEVDDVVTLVGQPEAFDKARKLFSVDADRHKRVMIIIARSHMHEHAKEHDHRHVNGAWGWFVTAFHLHGHNHDHRTLASDEAFIDNDAGIRTIWLALAALTITATLQMIIVYWSGSVSLRSRKLYISVMHFTQQSCDAPFCQSSAFSYNQVVDRQDANGDGL